MLLLLLLTFDQQFLSFDEPLGVTLYFFSCNLHVDTAQSCIVFPLVELLLVHLLIHSMHLPHLFDFVEVDHKAPLVCMVFLDALSTEDGEMV